MVPSGGRTIPADGAYHRQAYCCQPFRRMTPADEQALIDKVLGGDRAALGDLLRSNERRLFNVCLRMVSNRDDAAELTQDAMVKIVQNLDSFRGDARLTTWMTRVAMNLCLSHLRKRKLRHTVSLSSNGTTSADSDTMPRLADRIQDPTEPGPDSRVQQREMLDRLQSAIDRLDDDQRAVLVLRDLEQLDYLQIAQNLELPVGTVKSRLFRARLALRDLMNAASPTSPTNG